MVSKREVVPQDNIHALVTELRELIASARNTAARSVNTIQVITNFEIGRRIVKHEQQGEKRAEYGKALLKRSRKLFSSAKSQIPSGQLQKSETPSRKFTLSWSHYVFLRLCLEI